MIPPDPAGQRSRVTALPQRVGGQLVQIALRSTTSEGKRAGVKKNPDPVRLACAPVLAVVGDTDAGLPVRAGNENVH